VIREDLIEAACADCKTLCSSTDLNPSPQPHPALLMDWRKDSYAIFHCNTCGACLIENKLDPVRVWRWAPVQAFDRR